MFNGSHHIGHHPAHSKAPSKQILIPARHMQNRTFRISYNPRHGSHRPVAPNNRDDIHPCTFPPKPHGRIPRLARNQFNRMPTLNKRTRHLCSEHAPVATSGHRVE